MSMLTSSSNKSKQFTLICLPSSPYSKRVVWSLELLKFQYNKQKYSSIVGEPYVRYQLGRYNPFTTSITVPIGIVVESNNNDGVDGNTTASKSPLIFEHGIDIMEWSNEENKKRQQQAKAEGSNVDEDTMLDLIPIEQRTKVVEYCTLADIFQNYDRQMFLLALKENPSQILKAVMAVEDPNLTPPPSFMLTFFGTMIGYYMRTKYSSTLNTTKQEIHDKAKLLQDEIITKQKQKNNNDDVVYLIGNTVTVADIFMCVAICGGIQGNKSTTDDGSLNEKRNELQRLVTQNGISIKNEYPILYDWAESIRNKYGNMDYDTLF